MASIEVRPSTNTMPVTETPTVQSAEIPSAFPTTSEINELFAEPLTSKHKPLHYTKPKDIRPDYQLHQSNVLNSLRVGSVEDTLPFELNALYKGSSGAVGDITVEFTDKSKAIITTLDNNIVIVRKLKPGRKIWRLFPTYTIDSYYMIDRQNDKAWDVSQLWKSTSETLSQKGKTVQVIDVPWSVGFFAKTKEGPLLGLQRISDFLLRSKKNVYPEKVATLQGLDRFIPAHEAGHMLQTSKQSSDVSTETLLKIVKILPTAERVILLALLVTLPVWLPATVVLYNFSERFRRKLNDFDKYVEKNIKERVFYERNASAFGLAVVRQLKHQGIDLYRGQPAKRVFDIVDWALQTYDRPAQDALASQLARQYERRGKSLKKYFVEHFGVEYDKDKNPHSKKSQPLPNPA